MRGMDKLSLLDLNGCWVFVKKKKKKKKKKRKFHVIRRSKKHCLFVINN